MSGQNFFSSKEFIEQMIDMGKEFLKKYQKTSDFFLMKDRYVSFQEEAKEKGIEKNVIDQVQLQCSGQGSFKKNTVASRFLSTLRDVIKSSDKIKKVKLKISGFDLSQKIQPIASNQMELKMNLGSFSLTQEIQNLLKDRMDSMESLEIRITHVINCSMNDLKRIMQLGINQKALKLKNLTYEFSDWSFPKNLSKRSLQFDVRFCQEKKQRDKLQKYELSKMQRNGQPYYKQFYDSLDEVGILKPIQNLQKFRLEISTWYYTQFEMQKFFFNQNDDSKNNDLLAVKLKVFRQQFKGRIEGLISIMPSLKHMEIDLRNWCNKFEMAELKKQISNIDRNGRISSNSQVSRRITERQAMNYMLKLGSKVEQLKGSKNGEILNQEMKKPPTFDLIVII